MAKKSRGIQSIEVGGELLRALARSGEPMMLRDLAREAGMAPAKAHPYLASFSRIGLIEQDETNGRYEIGALADEARKNEVAEDRGDSNMIQAQGEW